MKDIPGYDNYKFDLDLQQVYNIKYNRYLKNTLDKCLYYVRLHKNGKGTKYSIRHFVNMYNPIENNNLVDIPNYEELYKFDIELNQVYNIKKNKYLKNHLTNYGYYQVGLCKNNIKTNFRLHQLVYMCNYPTEDLIGFEIDHIDNNKLNNKIENLRKCSHSDNMSNKKTHKNNKSTGIKYITTYKYGYLFQLTKNKIKYQKKFKKLEEAIEHRNRVVLEKCGEFANLG